MTLFSFLQSEDSRSDMIPTADPVSGTLPGGDGGVSEPLFTIFQQGSFLPFAGILGFLATVWAIYSILAYILAIIFLVLYVYASVQKNQYLELQTQALRDKERLYSEKFRGVVGNSRLKDVLNHSESDNPTDWRLAIIEADIILDDTLKKRGYGGNSLGERLKSISPHQLESLNDAWEAHKVRNRIAHDGADFVLTKRIVQETINRYQRVFNDFDVH